MMKTRLRGSALLSALLIMTLVAIAATAMQRNLQQNIYRTQATITHDKLYLATQAVGFWSLETLKNPSPIKHINGDKIFIFPKQYQTIYPGIKVTGYILDMQAKLNLINLSDPAFLPVFYQLLTKRTNLTDEKAKYILSTTQQWLKTDPNTDNDLYKQSLEDISQLRLIKGVSAQVYQTLQANIAILPEPTTININTAPPAILHLLGNGLNNQQVNTILHERKQQPFTNNIILSQLLKRFAIRSESITTESKYFLSVATANTSELNLTVYSLISRTKDPHGKIHTQIIRQSF